MPGSDSAWLMAVIALLVVLLLAAVLRRVWLLQACRGLPGTLRSANGATARGMLVYSASGLRWYRAVSLSPLPADQWSRQGFSLTKVSPNDDDAASGSGTSVVSFTVDGEHYELVLSTPAATGLSSWAEGGPPESAKYFS